MGIIDVFSKRNKKMPDVYTYDELPAKLRAQIVHIFEDAVGASFQNGEGWRGGLAAGRESNRTRARDPRHP